MAPEFGLPVVGADELHAAHGGRRDGLDDLLSALVLLGLEGEHVGDRQLLVQRARLGGGEGHTGKTFRSGFLREEEQGWWQTPKTP